MCSIDNWYAIWCEEASAPFHVYGVSPCFQSRVPFSQSKLVFREKSGREGREQSDQHTTSRAIVHHQYNTTFFSEKRQIMMTNRARIVLPPKNLPSNVLTAFQAPTKPEKTMKTLTASAGSSTGFCTILTKQRSTIPCFPASSAT